MDIDLKKLNQKFKPAANERIKKIFLWVLGGHIFVIFSPLAITYLGFIFKPKEKKIDTIKVTMVSPAAAQKADYKDPVLKPVPEQPKPKVKPQVKPKEKPKEKPKTKPKEQPKKVDNKKVNPPDKQKVKPKKPVVNDDISDLEVVRNIEEQTTKTPKTTEDTRESKNSTALIAPNVQGEKSDEFNARIAGVIYQMWDAPNSELIRGRNLQAIIQVKIDNTGRIIECSLVKKSNFPAFDWTVYELTKKLKNGRLPLPPDNRRIFDFVLQPLN